MTGTLSRQQFLYLSVIHIFKEEQGTLGGIASICINNHFQTDYQQTLRIQIQG